MSRKKENIIIALLVGLLISVFALAMATFGLWFRFEAYIGL